ncbi:MAG TPA: TetR/AcrR family transcriptional regulator [Streptosporangiaceae bacterium]|nr:TetR/AcrR family transcriptional regulator [Streptosporangiaceae bacterium]
MPRTSRRADVRATAARLFREHGYSSATMDLLADEVGLNKGTLYHYYPAKSAILYELLSDQLDITLALLAEVPAGGSATERMRTFIRLQVEHVASTPDELVVFFQEMPWIDKNLAPIQAADLRGRIETYRTFTRQLLGEGIAAGEFRPLDVDMIHYSIVGILAYIPVWFRVRAGRTRASLVSELADFVMSGVALAPAPARSVPEYVTGLA